MRNSISLGILLVSLGSAAALADNADPPKKLTVTSTAFKDGDAIPMQYTCDGSNKAPELSWSNVPSNAQSIAILVDDPDAPKGTLTHMLIVGILPTETTLPEGAMVPTGATAAKNDVGTTGYSGPCPPSGMHHYHFRVYALDNMVRTAGTRTQFLSAIKGHILAQGELVGTYEKTRTGSAGKESGSGSVGSGSSDYNR